MSWPEIETFDEMMKRVRRKVKSERKTQSEADKAKAERMDAPPKNTSITLPRDARYPLRRGPMPPQIERFPTDEELDRMWAKG